MSKKVRTFAKILNTNIMKKVFRLAAIAVLALGLTTACKQKAVEPEEVVDSTIEEVVEEIEEVVEDTITVVQEEPVAKPVVKKKKQQSAEAKPTEKKGGETITLVATDGSTTTNKAPEKVDPKDLQKANDKTMKSNAKKN